MCSGLVTYFNSAPNFVPNKAIAALCVLGALLFLCCNRSHASDMRFQGILGPEGYKHHLMGVGTIDTIRQDRLGFMWFGGENALLRYDGASFRRYEPSSSAGGLPSNAIRDIVVDHDAQMWIATDVGLVRYSDQQDQFTLFAGLQRQQDSLPSPSITSLAADKRNNLVIGTAYGVTILDRSRKIFTPLPLGEQAEPNKRYIAALFVDSKNRLWVGTRSAGLFLFSEERRLIRHYGADIENVEALQSNTVSSVTEDRLGRIWVGTMGGGVSRMEEGERALRTYHHQSTDTSSLAGNIVTQVYLDSDDDIWVATEQGGLARYQPESDGFVYYQSNAHDRFSLPSNKIKSIGEDRKGNLWVATFPGAISFYDRTHSLVDNFMHIEGDDTSLSHSGVLSFLKSRDGALWVGTEAGLNRFDIETQKVEQKILMQPDDPLRLSANAVLSLEEDEDGGLWVGTWAGGLQYINLREKTVKRYRLSDNVPNALPGDFVWSLMIDKKKTVWVGMEKSGLAKYQPESDDFFHYPHDPADPDTLAGNFVQALLEDSRGQFWIGTTGGLNILNRDTDQFTHFGRDRQVSGILVSALMEDSRGYIWVGTQGDGIFLYDYATKSFSPLPIPRAEITRISSFVEDNQGFVWAGTTTGILRINPYTQDVQVYNRHHGLSSSNYNRNSVFKDVKGNIYFGGINGFSIFDPRALVRSPDDYSIVLTDFKISNKSVEITEEGMPLSRSITFAEGVTLTNKQTLFSFTFSALDYRSMGENSYAFMMEGFNTDWHFGGGNNSANYTNLPAGNYVFKVKAADRDGSWGQHTAELKVHVLPSLWRTWWAYLLYAGVGLLLLRSLFLTCRQHMESQNKDMLRQEVAHINEEKDTFIKNTSYEFYQPVRDIVRLGEDALSESKGRLPHKVVQKIKSMVDRGNSLASIIYEMQDYGKLNGTAIEPHFSAVNLQSLVRDVFDENDSTSSENNIHLVNAVDDITLKVRADKTYLAQALSILIGSAIQNLKNGVVTVRAIVLVDNVQVEIEDTGTGIAQETYQALFGSGDTAVKNGAGVIAQLSQVKHLIELQGGTLICRSRWAERGGQPGFDLGGLGVGTCFSFTLPWADEAYSDSGLGKSSSYEFYNHVEEVVDEQTKAKDTALTIEELERIYAVGSESSAPAAVRQLSKPKSGVKSESIPQPVAKPALKPILENKSESRAEKDGDSDVLDKTLLIVDDDPINRMVLSGMLGMQPYNLIEVNSGPEALDLIFEQQQKIDLVLLDVMMPRMTGFEVCSKLREKFNASDLPVLFLTAKHEEQDLEKARASGGNDVLYKPVKKDSLLEHVNQYLKS